MKKERETKDPETGLTEREEIFCSTLAETYNKTEAAIAAGYGRRRDGSINRASAAVKGCELYKRPEIRKRYQEITQHAANEAGATALYVARRTKEIVERCLQEIKPELKFSGGRLVETGDFVFDGKTAVQALKLLADIQGMCKEIQRHEGDLTVTLSSEVDEYAG